MPKLKTKRGAAKRFSRTARGKFRCSHSHMRHILTKKSAKRKRKLSTGMIISKTDQQRVMQMLPYA